jgi:hypothetical protein
MSIMKRGERYDCIKTLYTSPTKEKYEKDSIQNSDPSVPESDLIPCLHLPTLTSSPSAPQTHSSSCYP